MISYKTSLLVLAIGILLMAGCGGPEQGNADTITASESNQLQASDTGLATSSEITENEAEDEPGNYNTASARTIPQNLEGNPNLSTFLAAATQTEILSILSKPGPYTVLVPSDEAFEAMPADSLKNLLKPENKQQLTALLSNHIIAGRLDAAALQHDTNIKTIGNGRLRVLRDDDKAMINGAEVLKADLESRNGLVHIVDKVLLPDKKEE